jgi:hypothetical protein
MRLGLGFIERTGMHGGDNTEPQATGNYCLESKHELTTSVGLGTCYFANNSAF